MGFFAAHAWRALTVMERGKEDLDGGVDILIWTHTAQTRVSARRRRRVVAQRRVYLWD